MTVPYNMLSPPPYNCLLSSIQNMCQVILYIHIPLIKSLLAHHMPGSRQDPELCNFLHLPTSTYLSNKRFEASNTSIAMAKNRNEPEIKLKQADRSAPTEKTLLELAEQSGVLNNPRLKTAKKSVVEEDDVGHVGRLAEAILWSVTLAMGHFTLDVLVANQYAMSIEWRELLGRTMRAFPGMQTKHVLWIQARNRY